MSVDPELEFLKEKWRVWFHLLDINKDGALTASDWNRGAQTVIEEHNLSGDQEESVRENFHKIGAKLLGTDYLQGKRRVEMHHLVDNLTAFYTESSVKAYQYIYDATRQLFMTMDVDCNSVVSRKEFVTMCKSLGIHSDSAAVFYEDLKHSDYDRVPVETVVNWWVDLWFGTDKQTWERFKNVSGENC